MGPTDTATGRHGLHSYAVHCQWSGSTAAGYDAYDRAHEVRALPGGISLELSSDPSFGGDPALLNPEQLLVMAAASCQLLSFLAAAARARVTVTGYVDEAVGIMPEDDRPVRITAITLRPTITVAPGTDEGRVRQLVDVAHRQCFVANSLSTAIELRPTVVVAGGA